MEEDISKRGIMDVIEIQWLRIVELQRMEKRSGYQESLSKELIALCRIYELHIDVAVKALFAIRMKEDYDSEDMLQQFLQKSKLNPDKPN